MPLLHGLRSFRSLLKGRYHGGGTLSIRKQTTRHYIGIRYLDLFAHVNNGKFLELFEWARWEAFARGNFNGACFQARVYPIVASVSINYFRTLSAFQVATVQTCSLGITANGNQFITLQSVFDSKGRLVATAHIFISMIDIKTQKPISTRNAIEKMKLDAEDWFICGQNEISLDNLNDEFHEIHKLIRQEDEILHPRTSSERACFSPKNNDHEICAEKCLRANTIAGANFAVGFKAQRTWLKGIYKKYDFEKDGEKVKVFNEEVKKMELQMKLMKQREAEREQEKQQKTDSETSSSSKKESENTNKKKSENVAEGKSSKKL